MWPPAVWRGQRGDSWILASTPGSALHTSEPLLICGKARGEDTSLDPTVSTSPSRGPCSLLTKEHRGPAAAADALKGYGKGLEVGLSFRIPGVCFPHPHGINYEARGNHQTSVSLISVSVSHPRDCSEHDLGATPGISRVPTCCPKGRY